MTKIRYYVRTITRPGFDENDSNWAEGCIVEQHSRYTLPTGEEIVEDFNGIRHLAEHLTEVDSRYG